MTNRMPRSLNYPLPPRYRTTVLFDQTVVVTPSIDTGFFDILGNCFYGSYDSSGPQLGGPLAVSALDPTLGLVQISATSTISDSGYTALTWYNAIPSGLGQLMPVPYNRCRVYGSKISLEVFPNQTAPNSLPFSIAIIPWKPDGTTPLGNTPPVRTADIAALPRGKQRMFNSTYTRRNILSSYISSAEALGVAKKAIQYDNQYAFGYQELPGTVGADQSATQELLAWRVAYNTTGASSGEPFTLNIKLRYYCEFFLTATGLQLSVNGSGPPPT